MPSRRMSIPYWTCMGVLKGTIIHYFEYVSIHFLGSIRGGSKIGRLTSPEFWMPSESYLKY